MLRRVVSDRDITRAKDDRWTAGGFVPRGIGRETHSSARLGDSSSEVGERVVQDLFEAPVVRPPERREGDGPRQLPSDARALGPEADQQKSYLLFGGTQVLRREHPSVERELATIGDRGTPTATFDEPDRVRRGPDSRRGRSREAEGFFLHEADERSCIVNRVPAVLGMGAVLGLAVEDDLEA